MISYHILNKWRNGNYQSERFKFLKKATCHLMGGAPHFRNHVNILQVFYLKLFWKCGLNKHAHCWQKHRGVELRTNSQRHATTDKKRRRSSGRQRRLTRKREKKKFSCQPFFFFHLHINWTSSITKTNSMKQLLRIKIKNMQLKKKPPASFSSLCWTPSVRQRCSVLKYKSCTVRTPYSG